MLCTQCGDGLHCHWDNHKVASYLTRRLAHPRSAIRNQYAATNANAISRQVTFTDADRYGEIETGWDNPACEPSQSRWQQSTPVGQLARLRPAWLNSDTLPMCSSAAHLDVN
jgi:hypothetical protein